MRMVGVGLKGEMIRYFRVCNIEGYDWNVWIYWWIQKSETRLKMSFFFFFHLNLKIGVLEKLWHKHTINI